MALARIWALIAVLLLGGLLTVSSSGRAEDAYYAPTAANQFVTTTDTYLYVVWSVPKDLSPFAHIKSRDELEAFVARTAVRLCDQHRAKEPSGKKDCKVQVLRMNSNDEYTKSAAGGFKTVATLVVPMAAITAELASGVKTQGLSQLKPLFGKYSFKHDELPLGAAK